MSRASDCYLATQQKQNTLVIREKTSIEKLPELISKSYCSIFPYVAEIGVVCSQVPFVIYHNMDLKNMDIEIGVVVPEKCDGKGDIKASLIEESLVAQTMHLGSYKETEPTYIDLEKFIKDNGLKPSGKVIEWYHNDWTTASSEERLITTIMITLQS